MIADVLQRGVTDGVFPLGRVEVFHRGQHVISTGNASSMCVFDLASVTKVMSTTALVLDTKLPIDARVRAFFPTAKVDASIADLMFHRSGLPAFIPFFARPGLKPLDGVLAAEPKHHGQAIYSDLGFILLGAILEKFTSTPLDELFETRIAKPLGLSAGYRRISKKLPLPAEFARTGATRPREPAPGQEGLWNVAEHPTALAEVDDDNAFVMDGVSGHAGLFGTALDVARFGQAVLEGRFTPPIPWRRDETTPGSTRALGFDTPSLEGASCGQRLGRGPLGAIGHLGFTGTSVWLDFDRQLVVALLTNRVALGRANVKIREFRPRLHDAVLDALGL